MRYEIEQDSKPDLFLQRYGIYHLASSSGHLAISIWRYQPFWRAKQQSQVLELLAIGTLACMENLPLEYKRLL
jgi:hypothetical protein